MGFSLSVGAPGRVTDAPARRPLLEAAAVWMLLLGYVVFGVSTDSVQGGDENLFLPLDSGVIGMISFNNVDV
jgi:hypothetical protein